MRRLEVVAEVACGRVGAHGTPAGRRFAVPASEAGAVRPADANARLTQYRIRHLLLRQSQVLDSKGAPTQRRK